MIKGCKRNIVWLKNTNSDVFDEAIFLVNDENEKEKINVNDVLEDVEKIIKETPNSNQNVERKNNINIFFLKMKMFLFGLLFGAFSVILADYLFDIL